MPSYLVQEEDGTSKFTLEEGGGSLLTEESTPSVGGTTGSGFMALLGVGQPSMENENG